MRKQQYRNRHGPRHRKGGDFLKFHNLYYHTLAESERTILPIISNVKSSFEPFITYLRRAIVAEKERKIKTQFEIIDDEKTLSLEKITLKYEILSKGTISFTFDDDWYEITNIEDFNEELRSNLNELIRRKLNYSSREEYLRITRKDIINEDNRLFLRFPEKPSENEEIIWNNVNLVYNRVIDDLDSISIEQNEHKFTVLNVEKEDGNQYSITFESSISLNREDQIKINGFPLKKGEWNCNYSRENAFKVINSDEQSGVKQEIEIIEYNKENNFIIIPKRNYHLLEVLNENGEKIQYHEIRHEPIESIEFNNTPVPLIEIDDNLYSTEYFPDNQAVVIGNDRNTYICHIRMKRQNDLRIRLLEDTSNESHEELSEKSNVDYFFEEDVEEIMGLPEYEQARRENLVFKIIGKNWENRTLKIKVNGLRDYREKKYQLQSLCRRNRFIYLNRNTYQLEMQLEFIENLMNKPLEEYIPLIRLSENKNVPNTKWDKVKLIEIKQDDWEILTNVEINGTSLQRKFIQIALGTPDFAFLEGPPGSGKTTTIVELILQLIKRKKRILLSASTHVAIDNVLTILKEKNKMKNILPIRIGDVKNISPDIEPFQIDNMLPKDEKSEKKFQNLILDASNLVCGTTVGILKHPLFKKTREMRGQRKIFPIFDYLIIDESSKTTFQEFIIPALFAKRWVLVGDIQQLSPYTEKNYLQKYFEGILKGNRKIFPEPDQKANFFLFRIFKDYAFSRNDKNNQKKKLFWCLPTSHRNLDALKREIRKRYEESKKRSKEKGISTFPLIVFISKTKNEQINPNNAYFEVLFDDIVSGNIIASLIYIADILFIDKDDLHGLKRYIPSHFMVINISEWDYELQQYRWQYFLEKNLNPMNVKKAQENYKRINKDLDERSWGSEISWRLIRLYELRNVRTHRKKYEEDISALMPRSVNLESVKLNAVGVALPSILESLQKGIQEKFRGKIETILKTGFPESVFNERHVRLKYQFRMHPEISAFSSKEFYGGNALINSESLEREWDYKRYKSRFIWINVRGKQDRNKNFKECKRLIFELNKFVKWAIYQDKDYKIAVLTYYRAQERLLREELRDFTRQRNRFSNFSYGNTKIMLHTVDKVQGKEADIVFLSMVRVANRRKRLSNRRVGGNLGFMDNPNRLNVALTRAKFQLVIIGDLLNFKDQDDSDILNKLANSITVFGNSSLLIKEKKRKIHLKSH